MFDPSTIETDNYLEILNCLKEKSSVGERANISCCVTNGPTSVRKRKRPALILHHSLLLVRFVMLLIYLLLRLLGPTTAMHAVATWMIQRRDKLACC